VEGNVEGKILKVRFLHHNNLKTKSGNKSRPRFCKKETLEMDLLAGEELQVLAKEVIVQPPEIIWT
jgi:hypothetical protein